MQDLENVDFERQNCFYHDLIGERKIHLYAPQFLNILLEYKNWQIWVASISGRTVKFEVFSEEFFLPNLADSQR